MAVAQTISPVIVEYREKAQGKFQLTNDSDFPLFVVLEPQSFSVDKGGNPTFRPLDPGIHVSLSTMSFRLAPKQVYTGISDFNLIFAQNHTVAALSGPSTFRASSASSADSTRSETLG